MAYLTVGLPTPSVPMTFKGDTPGVVRAIGVFRIGKTARRSFPRLHRAFRKPFEPKSDRLFEAQQKELVLRASQSQRLASRPAPPDLC